MSRYFLNKSGQALELNDNKLTPLKEILMDGEVERESTSSEGNEQKRHYRIGKGNKSYIMKEGRKKRKKITPEAIKNIQAMRDNKWKKSEVCKETGLSYATVNKYWNADPNSGEKKEWKPL